MVFTAISPITFTTLSQEHPVDCLRECISPEIPLGCMHLFYADYAESNSIGHLVQQVLTKFCSPSLISGFG